MKKKKVYYPYYSLLNMQGMIDYKKLIEMQVEANNALKQKILNTTDYDNQNVKAKSRTRYKRKI